LATAIAVHRARAGDGAYIASLETGQEELLQRMICAEGRAALHRCRSGTMTPQDWDGVTKASAALYQLPIWVDDASTSTAVELWSKARRFAVKLASQGRKLGIVVVDYIQLLRAPRSGMKREEVVAENARTLRAMAIELDCPVLALAQ